MQTGPRCASIGCSCVGALLALRFFVGGAGIANEQIGPDASHFDRRRRRRRINRSRQLAPEQRSAPKRSFFKPVAKTLGLFCSLGQQFVRGCPLRLARPLSHQCGLLPANALSLLVATALS